MVFLPDGIPAVVLLFSHFLQAKTLSEPRAPRIFFPAFLRLLLKNPGSLKGKVGEPFVSYLLNLSWSQDHQRSLRSEQDPHLSLSLWSEKSSVSCWSLEVVWKFPLGIVELSHLYSFMLLGSRHHPASWRNKQNIVSFASFFCWEQEKIVQKEKWQDKLESKEMANCKTWTKETLKNLKSLITDSTNHPDQLFHHLAAISNFDYFNYSQNLHNKLQILIKENILFNYLNCQFKTYCIWQNYISICRLELVVIKINNYFLYHYFILINIMKY